MFKALFGRFRARRDLSPSPPREPAAPSQKASVEEIWNSWRYEKAALQSPNITRPKSTINAAERVNQLKRLGEYGKALQITLAEVERDEREGLHKPGHPMVPWYYWEAAGMYRKLKRYDEEVALVRRFARNYDIHFRTLSKRYRSTSGANEAWAARFLQRLETAKALAAGRLDDKS